MDQLHRQGKRLLLFQKVKAGVDERGKGNCKAVTVRFKSIKSTGVFYFLKTLTRLNYGLSSFFKCFICFCSQSSDYPSTRTESTFQPFQKWRPLLYFNFYAETNDVAFFFHSYLFKVLKPDYYWFVETINLFEEKNSLKINLLLRNGFYN